MKKVTTSLERIRIRRTKLNASALVIVLAFVVLLTVVVLAIFSRSIFNGLISSASINVTKSDLYAHGAINQIVGDLEQEIVAGSTTLTPTGSVTIYRPGTFAASVPANAGPASYADSAAAGITTTGTTTVWNTMPNLVKQSYHGVNFEPYDTSVPARAADAPSTTASRNGRYVSLVRWNKALLLPKSTAFGNMTTTAAAGTAISADGATSTAPLGNFTAPDWILTAADGSNPTTWPSSPVATIANPKSASYVVGRYAYTIYNEGGLLDANVAGCPAGISNMSGSSGITQATVISRKGPSAFADLTQLPGIGSLPSSPTTPAQVVQSLVGWRNSASVQAQTPANIVSPFPTYNFTQTTLTNYLNYLLGVSNNFMSTGNTLLNAGLSDRVFTTRQQMISFFVNTIAQNSTEQAYLQDAMMYLGTFSRSLNQPSYWPDPGTTRPTVVNYGYPGTDTTQVPYGNDAYKLDNPTVAGSYNPAFRNIRVASSFVRPFPAAYSSGGYNPDGTTAVVGEPLVKKRFALNRLAWISYKGPLNSLSSGDALFTQYTALGVPNSLITQWTNEGTAANIQAYFGLTWHNGPAGALQPGGYWVYDPDSDEQSRSATGTIPMIKTLDEVAKQNREPNFFELLKAAICAGSIAKVGMPGMEQSLSSPDYKYLAYRDSQVDYQIFQMGANIISQASPANYPTQIVAWDTGLTPSGNQSFIGVTDFPYLYETGHLVIENVLPSPNPPPATSLTPISPGKVVLLQVPIVWNPHTPGASGYLSGLTPTKFRIGVSDMPLSAISSAATPALLQGWYQVQPSLSGTTTLTGTIPPPFNTIYAPWGNSQTQPSGSFPTAGTWTQSTGGAGYGTTPSNINPVETSTTSTASTYATNTGLIDFNAVGSNPNTEIYFDGDSTGTLPPFSGSLRR